MYFTVVYVCVPVCCVYVSCGVGMMMSWMKLTVIFSEIFRAVNNLTQPNEKDAMAVDARTEVDLRIGAVFTR